MSSLVPERRVNKNGVSVIKHVKNGLPAPKSSKSLPQPKLSPAKTAQKTDDPLDSKVMIRSDVGSLPTTKLLNAAKQEYGIDSVPRTVVMTSRQYYAAKRANLTNFAMCLFAEAGVTETDEMVAFCLEHDKKHRIYQPPGIAMRQERWVDALVEAGIPCETVEKAKDGYYGLKLDQLSSPDADRCNPADVVRTYAEFPKGKNREKLVPLVWEGKLTFDEIKKHGATRLARHEEVLRYFVFEKPQLSLDDVMALAKHEEKSFSPFEKSVTPRVQRRADAAVRWGLDRALQLRMPSAGFEWYKVSEMIEDNDESFRFMQFHEEVQHQAILRGSEKEPSCNTVAFCDNFASSKEYAHITKARFYKPDLTKTLPYFELGLTAEETIRALEEDKSPRVVLAKKEGGIHESLGEGWL